VGLLHRPGAGDGGAGGQGAGVCVGGGADRGTGPYGWAERWEQSAKVVLICIAMLNVGRAVYL